VSDARDIEQADVTAVNAGAKTKVTATLYAARVKIFPKDVQGTFRRLKWIIMAVTLGIYYLTPWLRWDRGPNAPDQAVLLDMAHRRFYFFFIEIWPQEFYFVAGLLVMAGVGLFLVTSVVGRAWCGYACPQTVWTDLFIAVERFIEGDRNARIKLDKAPYGLRKLGLRASKHLVWLLIAIDPDYFRHHAAIASNSSRFHTACDRIYRKTRRAIRTRFSLRRVAQSAAA